MGLEDYKDIVGTSAMISTMGHMLSGTLLCKDFYKKGTSDGFDPSPFVGGIGMSVIMLRYALILQDSTMIIVNLFGITVNIIYMTLYMRFSSDKSKGIQFLGKAAGFILLVLVYAEYENEEVLEFRYGLIVTTLFLCLVASPFLHIGEIIRTKDTSMLPFPLIFMGTFVFVQWLLYGLIIGNNFIIFQNSVTFLMSAIQLSLFVIYPSKPKVEKKTE